MSHGLHGPRNGHEFKDTSAEGNARQQNGDQIYGTVQSVHHGDTYNTTQSVPSYIPQSSYLSAQRWIDEPKNNAALVEASKYGQLKRIAYLLCQPDKDVNYVDDQGYGALHYAAQNGHIEVMQKLIAQGGANPGLQNKVGTSPTPLILAVQRGDYKATKLLLESGAPIHSSFSTWNKTAKRFDITNALAEAILGGSSDLVSLLLEHGASVKEDTRPEMQPLSLAMLVGRPDLVDILLDNGATLDNLRMHFPVHDQEWPLRSYSPYCGHLTGSFWQQPPLAWAMQLDDKAELLRALIKRDLPLSWLQEAFYLAALMGNIQAMDCLLANGVDVDCEYHGRKALHLVSFFNVGTSIDYLLERGAKIHQMDSEHDFVIWDQTWSVVAFSMSDSGDPWKSRALRQQTMSTSIRDLTATFAVPVVSDECKIPSRIGAEPIHYAVGSPAALERLVEHGADVNAISPGAHSTPLHVAAALLDPDSARWLIAHGANLLTGSGPGHIPYDVALNQITDGDSDRKRKRELLDMLRIIPLSDLRMVIQTDFAPTTPPPPQPTQKRRGSTSGGSWAWSEQYSTSSRGMSERYTVSSRANSNSWDMGEIVEENGSRGEQKRPRSKKRSRRT